MEYEVEDIDFNGTVPEFGAIFIANVATKKLCFKQKLFGLPSVMANFVRHVKAGMVLFLFEHEKRQLFGVFKATSDGAINIMPYAFRSSGKQFPAQVRFTPIWICKPLSENEFKGSIHKNYYSPRKFKFGLSEDQVRNLLQLFSTRKLKSMLPSKQFNKGLRVLSAKGGRCVDGGRSSERDRPETDYNLEGFSPSAAHRFSLNLGNRGMTLNDGRLFTVNEVYDEQKDVTLGQEFVAHNADDFLTKKGVNCGRYVTDLRGHSDPLLESGTANLDLGMDSERVSATYNRSCRDEERDGNCNVFKCPGSENSSKFPKFPMESSDFRKTAGYEWPYFRGKMCPETECGRSLMNGIMKSGLDSNHFLADHTHKVDTHETLYCENLHMVGGVSGKGKSLMSEKVLGGSHNDDFISLGIFPDKLGAPLDGEQRKIHERSFSAVDNYMETGYMDDFNKSIGLNIASAHDTGIESQVVDHPVFNRCTSGINVRDIGNVTMAGSSTKYNAFGQPNINSSEYCSMPFTQFSEYSQNFKTSGSTYQDDIVTKTLFELPEPALHHVRSVPMRVDYCAGIARDTDPYLSERNCQAVSRSRLFEGECLSGFHPSNFRRNVPDPIPSNYRDYPTTEISDSIRLRSSAAEYKSIQFSPSSLGSASMEDPHDFLLSNSRLSGDVNSRGVFHDMQKYFPEDVATPSGLQSNGNITDLDVGYHQEYDPMHHDLDWYDMCSAHVRIDDKQYNSSLDDACTDSVKNRRSVFTRLTSTSRVQTADIDQEKYTENSDISVDEMMELLRQSQNSGPKTLEKRKHVVRQRDEGEMTENVTVETFDKYKENGRSELVKRMNREANKETEESFDETLMETRAVEFKRRRGKSQGMCEKTGCGDLQKEENVAAETPGHEVPLDKQPKRRKLVRPVF